MTAARVTREQVVDYLATATDSELAQLIYDARFATMLPETVAPVEGEAYLAERIRQEREERGWSHSELARRMAEAGCAGLPRNAMLRAERRERGISVDELVALSRVFDLPVNNLLTSVERADRLQGELEEASDAVRRYAVHKLEPILNRPAEATQHWTTTTEAPKETPRP